MELNDEQKAAIMHDTGPLLIIAGAGTGKTRVITNRIVDLINRGKAKAPEVLALTFTEKASAEMLERVDEMMPLGYEEVCIKTFHGFSDQILRESGLEIGLDPGYKILSQVDQWFFFKKHLFEFELDYYRPLGNPNRFIYALLSHFSKLKDELITPEAYVEYAEKLEGDDAEKVLEVAKTYKRYQELLLANNSMDFGDLSFYANKLLTERESCLRRYREKYKYVLVDEFQDTNYAQFQLVLKLASGHQNLTVVGDDDQSIYKWRGASLSNILQFEDHFPGVKEVLLVENYRSTQEILDASYRLVQNNNPDRLEVKNGIDKRLVSARGKGNLVEIHHFEDFLGESKFVADEIMRLQEEDGVEWKDFAILLRANQQTHPFIEELKRLGIPYQVRNPKGLFALEEIRDLIGLARVLANPYDDISFLRLLKMDLFEIQMEDILALLNKGTSEHIYDSLKMRESDNMAIPGAEIGVEKVLALVSELIEFSKKNPVGLVLNEFLQNSGLVKYLVRKEDFASLENINEFAKQVAKFEKENDAHTILDFVSYLDLLEEAGAVFATDSFSDRNSVQILTTHGSKGLEFDYVFVANAVKGRFPSTRRSETFSLPEELTEEIYPEGDFHLQEERRLFYVAMTRARKKLHISYSDQYEGSKKWKPSPFLEEIRDCEACKVIEHEADGDAFARLQEFKKPLESSFELPKFTRKKLSYSQLDTFKGCPLKYNYRYLMKVPVPSSHAANFGSAVHETLNHFYMRLKRGDEVSLEVMKRLYEKNWIPYGYDSIEHENIRREKGWEILENFYEQNSKPWVVPAYLERPFNLKIGEHWLNGRIDRIDKLEDGTYEVIDYKTGRLKERMNLDRNLQLSIYALACRDILKMPVSKLSLYYLEDAQKVSTTRSEEQLSKVHSELSGLIGEMQASEFSPTPGFHCQWCDFKMICPAG
jgi:DNA helicase II / ATP-dependent DNA helicase PcrA